MTILLKLNYSEQHLDFNKVSHEKGLICENKMLEAFFMVAATGIK